MNSNGWTLFAPHRTASRIQFVEIIQTTRVNRFEKIGHTNKGELMFKSDSSIHAKDSSKRRSSSKRNKSIAITLRFSNWFRWSNGDFQVNTSLWLENFSISKYFAILILTGYVSCETPYPSKKRLDSIAERFLFSKSF